MLEGIGCIYRGPLLNELALGITKLLSSHLGVIRHPFKNVVQTYTHYHFERLVGTSGAIYPPSNYWRQLYAFAREQSNQIFCQRQ